MPKNKHPLLLLLKKYAVDRQSKAYLQHIAKRNALFNEGEIFWLRPHKKGTNYYFLVGATTCLISIIGAGVFSFFNDKLTALSILIFCAPLGLTILYLGYILGLTRIGSDGLHLVLNDHRGCEARARSSHVMCAREALIIGHNVVITHAFYNTKKLVTDIYPLMRQAHYLSPLELRWQLFLLKHPTVYLPLLSLFFSTLAFIFIIKFNLFL